jgi:hypothetical protein
MGSRLAGQFRMGGETARLCDGLPLVGHFISNLIASWAQPDTGFPPKVVAGR